MNSNLKPKKVRKIGKVAEKIQYEHYCPEVACKVIDMICEQVGASNISNLELDHNAYLKN